MTKAELLGSLQHEVRVLLHLAGKIDRVHLDYRPTPKQRTTPQLLQCLSIMGRGLVKVAQVGTFDPAAWRSRKAPKHRVVTTHSPRSRRSSALRLRRLSYPAVSVSESVRPPRIEHDQSV